jgi:hypothetical protein
MAATTTPAPGPAARSLLTFASSDAASASATDSHALPASFDDRRGEALALAFARMADRGCASPFTSSRWIVDTIYPVGARRSPSRLGRVGPGERFGDIGRSGVAAAGSQSRPQSSASRPGGQLLTTASGEPLGAKTVESGVTGPRPVGHDGDFLCWSGRSAEPRGSLLEVVQFRSKVRDSASYRSCRRGVPSRSRWSTLLESVLERIWVQPVRGA